MKWHQQKRNWQSQACPPLRTSSVNRSVPTSVGTFVDRNLLQVCRSRPLCSHVADEDGRHVLLANAPGTRDDGNACPIPLRRWKPPFKEIRVVTKDMHVLKKKRRVFISHLVGFTIPKSKGMMGYQVGHGNAGLSISLAKKGYDSIPSGFFWSLKGDTGTSLMLQCFRIKNPDNLKFSLVNFLPIVLTFLIVPWHVILGSVLSSDDLQVTHRVGIRWAKSGHAVELGWVNCALKEVMLYQWPNC